MLSVEDATKRFGNLTAVDDVSFTIGSDEIVGLIGPNGAGKTTLFNVINGIYELDGGSVTLDGLSLDGMSINEIARAGIGRAFQIVRTFNESSVVENVATGVAFGRQDGVSPREAREEAQRYIDFVEIDGKELLPTKSLTLAGRRRVELARALATEPAVLLLDETASGLNTSEVNDMTEMIERIKEELEISIFWIEHNMKAIMETVDRIIVIHHGEKLADGTPTEIQNDENVSEAYLGEEII